MFVTPNMMVLGGSGFSRMRNRAFRYLRTASGYPLTLTDCMAAQPVSLLVAGNTDGVGDKWNLIDETSVRDFNNWKHSEYGETSGGMYRFKINLKKDTTYTFWCEKGTWGVKTSSFNDHANLRTIVQNKIYIITTKSNKDYIYLRANVYRQDKVDEFFNAIGKIMLFEGTYDTDMLLSCKLDDYRIPLEFSIPTSRTSQEPQICPIYIDAPLYSSGNTIDEILLDVKRKKATLTRRVNESDVIDMSDKVYWDGIPALREGTNILMVQTENAPQSIVVQYYSSRKGA